MLPRVWTDYTFSCIYGVVCGKSPDRGIGIVLFAYLIPDRHHDSIQGKALAGIDFILEELPDGDIILKRAIVIPANERWLHEPAMQQRLAQAEKWLQDHPFKEQILATWKTA